MSRSFPPGVAHYGALVGALSRDRDDTDPLLVAARSNLSAAKLRAAIVRDVDRGVLADEQRQALAELLLTYQPDTAASTR